MVEPGGQRQAPPQREPATPTPFAAYDAAPTFPIASGQIETGYEPLARTIAAAARNGVRRFAFDGFGGVPWEHLTSALDARCRPLGVTLAWRDIRDCLLDQPELDARIEPCLGGDDPLFGKLFDGTLLDFFDADRLQAIANQPSEGPVAYYGPGAALAGTPNLLVYVDVPKHVIQRWMRDGTATNIGPPRPDPFAEAYKRAYFVDWPALNRHKARLLPSIDLFVDIQDPARPAAIAGANLRAALDEVARHPFRVRPWFAPGPWGGQWLKRHVRGLDQDAPNYAWSFELIVPENGLVLGNGEHLECSFDLLMYHAHERVLGRAAARFGHAFPLRFDYLDTIDGGNLSIQCHPRPDYIREWFGEPFTQDESYYIVAREPGARVYLGFRDDVEPGRFRDAVETSRKRGATVDIDRHVNAFTAQPHDLFLIPSGTIHASGTGNLVLEISATPYIYTFKIYDWVRRDLDGNPRPLNIERAWDNLDFNRREAYARDRLRPQPRVLAEGPGWRELFLGSHDDLFYAVHRYDLDGKLATRTDDRCHVLNVVEGEGVTVETSDGQRTRFNGGETFVIPAAAGAYALTPVSGPCKVVKAFVK
ncbi:MAG: class I mannose-6-phosphate isomerase [Chloroflexia bacterium]|nr:class I mannose-6-phosphate isomerase [Chloroflexia bacterium]